MGITTLINVSVDLIYTEYGFGGTRFLYFIWAVWWIDIFISVVCCWGMVHIMTISHTHTLQEMTAAWLLPVVTLTVAASSGGVLSLALTPHSPSHALLTTTLAVFLVTVGLTLALMIMTIYLLRLILYGLPPGRRILSVFLPLGPTAQSGYAVLLIGQNYRTLLPLQQGEFTASQAGETVYVVCVCVTLLLWSLAVMCIAFAMLGIFDSLRRRSHVPFGLPFWGLVFPNGVFANLTLALARTFDARFFRVLGSIYAVLTLLVWCFVAIRTARVVWDRTIFDEDQQMDPGDDRGRKLLRSADTR
ncbi:hypothetical protein DXG01_007856 [Tephrocybe rancida]|nr:hypothetical protein DXG01_007856 [Tephrocybe rancida]